MPVFVPALLSAAFSIALTTPSSVVQCGADPTGKADSTQAFNACLSATPSGDVLVPAGTFKINGTIIKDRSHNLIGAGAKASILQCHATYTPCIVAADTTGGPTNYVESHIEDLTIDGPGTAGGSIGVFLGGDPNGHFNSANAYGDAVDFVSARITGFNRGIEWGNNAWNNKIVRSQVFANATGLYASTGLNNSGENIGITDSVIFNNTSFGIDDHANFEWMISGTAFDYNNVAIEFFGSAVHTVNCHFEQGAAPIVTQPYGMGTLSIRDSEILVGSNQGSDTFILNTWPQTLSLTVDDVSIWSNHPVQYFMKVQGAISGTITNLYGNGNRMIGKLSDQTSGATLTAVHIFQ